MSANPTVKIVRFHELGGPEVLKIDNLPMPAPEAGEVRLRVHAFGLNRAEIMFRNGQYLVEPDLPSKLGYEAAGVVEAVGPDVDKGLIGKKFSTVPSFNARDYGVYGEVAIVPASALAHYPEHLSAKEATSIWMPYITAYGALIHYGHITNKDTVVITAASSSVGLAAIDMVRSQGATAIAITRRKNKKSELLALGAHHVVVSEEEDTVKAILAITKERGANIVFDPIAGKQVETLMAAMAEGGTYFAYGALASEPTPFPLFTALSKGIALRGYTLFEILAKPAVRAEAEAYIFERLAAKEFKPRVARSFTLDQIVDAHRYMESNEQIGKIVVTV